MRGRHQAAGVAVSGLNPSAKIARTVRVACAILCKSTVTKKIIAGI